MEALHQETISPENHQELGAIFHRTGLSNELVAGPGELLFEPLQTRSTIGRIRVGEAADSRKFSCGHEETLAVSLPAKKSHSPISSFSLPSITL